MIKAFIFDWAGTMVDFGSLVPAKAMLSAFEESKLPVSEADIRTSMGMAKRAHIESILAIPAMAERWQTIHGASWTEQDLDRLLDAMERHTIAQAVACAVPIPGALDLVAALRARDIRVGSTTGYTRPIMEKVAPEAARHGYEPDVMICAGDVLEGRPAPLMIWKALVDMGVWPAGACVKVDDSPVGITAGRNAGLITIGLSASGNGVGLSADKLAALSPPNRERRLQNSADLLFAAGADYVVETVADIEPLLDPIAKRAADNLTNQKAGSI